MKRVYYSGYVSVNTYDTRLPALKQPPLVRENRLIHIPKQVEKPEESAEWPQEWYEQMAEEINDSPITLEVDGTMVDPQLGSLRMSQDGQFMIPYGMLPDALSCAVLLYDGNRIVMERGNTHAEMTVGIP